MRNLAGAIFLLLLLTCSTATRAESPVVAVSSGGTIHEETSVPDVRGRKVYFMDGSVGYVRPDGFVFFEEDRKEPPREKKIRVRLRAEEREELKREEPAEPDWYKFSEPTGKSGERMWTGPAALFRFGDQSGKVLTINPDGSQKIIQTYADGSRLIDDPALPHLRRILPDGTTLLLERSRKQGE